MISLGSAKELLERVDWALKDISRRMSNLEKNYRNLGKHQRAELRRQDSVILQIQGRDAEISALKARVKHLEDNSERQAIAIAGLIKRVGRLAASE